METNETILESVASAPAEENFVKKTVIRANTAKYVKTRNTSGKTSLNNGDTVAATLAKATLEQTYEIGSLMLNATVGDLKAKYAHLNAGQQRMNLGNRIRGRIAKVDRIRANEPAAVSAIAEAVGGIDGFGEFAAAVKHVLGIDVYADPAPIGSESAEAESESVEFNGKQIPFESSEM